MRLGRAESQPLVTLVDFALVRPTHWSSKLGTSHWQQHDTSLTIKTATSRCLHNQIHTHLKSHKLLAELREYSPRHYLEYEHDKASVLPPAVEIILNTAPQTA